MLKRKLGLCVVALTTSLVAESASADVVPGSIGHGWPNSAQSCFQNSNGAMINWCTDAAKKLILPIPMWGSGSYCGFSWADVTFSGNGTDATVCRLFRVYSNNGVTNYGEVARTANTFWTAYWADGTEYVQLNEGQTFQVECDVAKASGSNIASVLRVAIFYSSVDCATNH